MCRSCLNRRSFLAGAAVLPVAGCDRAPNLVSDAQVAQMGLQAWEQIQEQTPPSRNDSYQNALREVTQRLLDVGGAPDGEWEVQVFASPEANAFALPGGKIGVYEGMFDVMSNEDQLAAIVGHEIGHLSAEHGQERMSAQVAKNTGVRILGWLLNTGGVEYGTEIAAALGLGVEVGLLLPYNRDQELEADILGLDRMAAAGYPPEAAVALWRAMQSRGGRRGPEFLATHPTPAGRIERIEEYLAQG